MTLEIKTADELINAELEARWAARRAARHTEVLQLILQTFVDQGGPVPVAEVMAGFPGQSPETVQSVLRSLDEADLIRIQDDQVDVAYPFSAAPTAFVLRLADGRERYACCAIDALGMAPMLGERVEIRSRCHHCGAPLGLAVRPEGPEPAAHGLMVWVGHWEGGECRIATGL
jgi:mercuric reductase